MAADPQLLCVVCPCYNEEDVVEQFYAALKPVLLALSPLNHRILFVDDGSQDRTLERLNSLAGRDPAVQVYSLSRNFGHQIALTAGLDAAHGDAIVMMDSDLQHPPGLIPEMVRLWREGHDVVSAVRRATGKSGQFKRISSRAFYGVINFLSDTRIVSGAADFCLLSRQAHRALRKLPERHRFLRGMVSWIGFNRAFIFFDAPDRPAGRSKYTLFKMLQLAFNATFSFSATPIRLATQLGFFTVLLSLVYLLFVLTCYFLGWNLAPGWASIIFLVTFLGGVQLAFVGILGEYIARIFEEVKHRPLYLFKQKPPAD